MVNGIVSLISLSVFSLLAQEFFLTQGSNPHLHHWQADSFPSEPLGRPTNQLYFNKIKFTKKEKKEVLISPGSYVQLCLGHPISFSRPAFSCLKLTSLDSLHPCSLSSAAHVDGDTVTILGSWARNLGATQDLMSHSYLVTSSSMPVKIRLVFRSFGHYFI